MVRGKPVWANPLTILKAGHISCPARGTCVRISSMRLSIALRWLEKPVPRVGRWHRTQNLWAATGQMLDDLRA